MPSLRNKPFIFEGRPYTPLQFSRTFGIPAKLAWHRINHGIMDQRLPINANLRFKPYGPRQKSCPRIPMYVRTYFGEYKV